MAPCVIALFLLSNYTRRTTVEGVVMPDTGLVEVYAQHRVSFYARPSSKVNT